MPLFFRVSLLLAKAWYYLTHFSDLVIKIKYYSSKWLGRDTRSYAISDSFESAYRRKSFDYLQWVTGIRSSASTGKTLTDLINAKSYRGILVYPSTVSWEPLQRPQQLLRAMGKMGYLCFFCEEYQPQFGMIQVDENVFTISGEQHLLAPLQSFQVIILCTWIMSIPFINLLPNCIVWYDIIDRLEIFSLYDHHMLQKHDVFVNCVDIVSYSGRELRSYVINRSDAFYLPNGVVVEDFTNQKPIVIDDQIAILLQTVKSQERPIIGFFGAIAEWLDQDLILKVAQSRPDWEFFFIGRQWTDTSKFNNIPNLHLTGLVPYRSIPFYAKQFDVAIIPFIVNQMINSVSPIKLFEYAALGLPIVATPFNEIQQYKNLPFLFLASDVESFKSAINDALQLTDMTFKDAARKFADENHWDNRAEIIDNALRELLVHRK